MYGNYENVPLRSPTARYIIDQWSQQLSYQTHSLAGAKLPMGCSQPMTKHGMHTLWRPFHRRNLTSLGQLWFKDSHRLCCYFLTYSCTCSARCFLIQPAAVFPFLFHLVLASIWLVPVSVTQKYGYTRHKYKLLFLLAACQFY